MKHEECRPQLLAHTEVGKVSLCAGCGQVHLTLQFMTLRFEPEAFRSFVAMLGNAQHTLERESAGKQHDAPVLPAASGVH